MAQRTSSFLALALAFSTMTACGGEGASDDPQAATAQIAATIIAADGSAVEASIVVPLGDVDVLVETLQQQMHISDAAAERSAERWHEQHPSAAAQRANSDQLTITADGRPVVELALSGLELASEQQLEDSLLAAYQLALEPGGASYGSVSQPTCSHAGGCWLYCVCEASGGLFDWLFCYGWCDK